MEQDAVETLMFMSSPGNSQQYPNNTARQQQQQQQKQQQHLCAPNTTAATGTALPSPRFTSPSQTHNHPPAALQNGTSGRHKRRKSATEGVVPRRRDHDLGDDGDLTDDGDGEEDDDDDDDNAIIVLGGSSGSGGGGDVAAKGYAPLERERDGGGDELDRILDGMGGGLGSGSSTEGEA
jgi:hypothetical protein